MVVNFPELGAKKHGQVWGEPEAKSGVGRGEPQWKYKLLLECPPYPTSSKRLQELSLKRLCPKGCACIDDSGWRPRCQGEKADGRSSLDPGNCHGRSSPSRAGGSGDNLGGKLSAGMWWGDYF